MVWQPTMRVWAGDEVKIDEKELESESMEGIEVTNEVKVEKPKGGSKSTAGSGEGSARSMSVSATGDEEDA